MTADEFGRSYYAYNRLPQRRIRQYLGVFADFEAFTGAGVEEITGESFRAWMGDLLARGNHVNTVLKKGNCIRAYVRHAWEHGDIDAETFLRIKGVKNPRGASNNSIPNPYTMDEVSQLYREVDARWKTVTPRQIANFRAGGPYRYIYPHMANIQVKAMIALALDCGMRRGEMYHAQLVDIDPDNSYVVVRTGKAIITGEPRFRTVPWRDEARMAVGTWLEVRRWLNPTHESPWLVLHPMARPVGFLRSHPANAMRVKAFGALLGQTGRGWSLQRLRHTCATNYLRAGMPLEAVSRLMGHATLQQTLCYADLDRHDVEAHAERVHRRVGELQGVRT